MNFVPHQEYAKKFPKKIIILKNKKNMGLNFTLNKCISFATAPYIARMDGDDECSPERLEKEYLFLKNNKRYSFVCSNAILFDDNGSWGEVKYVESPSKMDFLKISPFCHASALIETRALKDVGTYSVDKKLLRVEDYHLWFKLYANNYFGYNIQENLYFIRDDRNATYRRNWKNRINEFYVKKIGFKMINIPFVYKIYCLRPLILGIIPPKVYEYLRKIKLKGGKS